MDSPKEVANSLWAQRIKLLLPSGSAILKAFTSNHEAGRESPELEKLPSHPMDRSRRGSQYFFPHSTGRGSVILSYPNTKRAGECDLSLHLGREWKVYTNVSFILVTLKLFVLCPQNYLACSNSTHFMFCELLSSFISVLLILHSITSSLIYVLSFLSCVWEETPPILKHSIMMSHFWWCSLSGYPIMPVPENSLLSFLYDIISVSIIYQILILETLKSLHI